MPDAEATGPAGDKISVVLVEDEDLYRDLLRIVLSQRPHLEVVGAFADGESALVAVPALRPHVAILDIELPGGLNGIQVGVQLRRSLPDLGIVVLSNHDDPEFVASLPRKVIAGWSYLLKKSVTDVEALERAIEGAAAKLVVLDPALVLAMHARSDGLLRRLTPRQHEILGLIAQGFTNAAIARRLVLSEKSVENQTNALYRQLGIDSEDTSLHPRVKAVRIYLQESLTLSQGRRWGVGDLPA